MDEITSCPPELLRIPQPLISFYGLDVKKETHKKIWDTFHHNRSNDRYSIYFNNLTEQGLNFPPPKTSKTSYEWYASKGILKKNWINKYQNIIPSVIVLFTELDWTDPEIKSKTESCAQQVQALKEALKGRGSKIAIILIQNDKNVGSSDSVTSFCTECEISPRSLFVIALQDSLLPTIIRLETSLHELSQNFYHLEIKYVRSHNEALNKSTHLLLMVRHMFKIGYFNEMKSDLHSAHKSYQTAYALMLEAKRTDFNLSEYRTVAGYISYKICRLAFKLNLARDALAQFRRHMDNFKWKSGVAELGWEHAAWQSLQAEMFANLFLSQGGGSSVMIHGQHPGVHYQLAAEYAISRRKLAEEQCSQIQSYPSPDPLLQDTAFYGQRAWRSGKIEPVDMQREKEGIQALQYLERTKTKHCQIITKLQESAIQQFHTFSSLRMKNNVQVQMADELLIDEKHAEALDILMICADLYRKEGWTTLATACLLKAIKCAFLIVNVETYLSLCLYLTSKNSECNDSEKKRVEQNFLLVVDESKPPLPEPSLTGKSERALVGQATKMWKTKLEEVNKNAEMISVPVPDSSSLDARPTMPRDARLGDPLQLNINILNEVGQSVAVLCNVKFNNPEYNTNSDDGAFVDKKCSEGGKDDIVYNIKLQSEDVSKKVWVTEIVLVLENSPKFAFCKKLDEGNCESNIIPRESKVDIVYLGDSPALVAEWFCLTIGLESKEEVTASNIEVLCWLRDGGDPLISDTTCLNTSPQFAATTPTTPAASSQQNIEHLIKSCAAVESLAAGATSQIKFYMHASTVGSRAVSCQLRYNAELEEATFSSSAKVIVVDVVQPFNFTYTLYNKMLEQTKTVYLDENFSIVPKVTCCSPHQLQILDSRLETRSAVAVSEPTHSLSNTALTKFCSVSQMFPAMLNKSKMITMKDTENLGKFYLKWRRTDSDITNETSFELQTIHVADTFLSLTCKMPGFGVLRSPVTIQYIMLNKTAFIQEYSLIMEPSDSFMFSGPKQLKLKIFPHGSVCVRYLLNPLLSGNLTLPKLKMVPLTSAGVPSLDKVRMLEELLARSIPSQFFVLPQDRSQKKMIEAGNVLPPTTGGPNAGNFEMRETVIIPNHGFSKQTVKATG